MRRIGLDVHVQEVATGRPNVIGVLEGRAPGRSLMFCGHVDTVGVEGMDAPFDPEIRAGRLYGRGSQDMKGGVAAMIDAARLAAARGLARGRLIVAAVVDEEYASIGADALVRDWTADGAVVTEPTDLQVAVGHKGFAWIDVETLGRAAHGSRPRDGRDAIMRMGRVLQRLESARSRAAVPPAASDHGTRFTARVDRRAAAASSAPIRIDAGCRWSGGRLAAKVGRPRCGRSRRFSTRWRARIRRIRSVGRA